MRVVARREATVASATSARSYCVKPFSASCDSDMKAFALAEGLLAFLDSPLVGKRSLEKFLRYYCCQMLCKDLAGQAIVVL